jgi:hypothetical protein
MVIEREVFDRIGRTYKSASWAVWSDPEALGKAGVGNLEVFDPEKNPGLLDTLHTEIVLVGLNASGTDSGQQEIPAQHVPYSNFHSDWRWAQDYKIRRAAYGTMLWGAYMTDLIKDHTETDSSKVVARLKASPELLTRNATILCEELADIGAKEPRLVAFGGKTAGFLNQAGFKNVTPITHYAHRINAQRYVEAVHKTLPQI